MPGQRSKPAPSSLGRGCTSASVVTCHLHIWQNDRGKRAHMQLVRESSSTVESPRAETV